MKPVKIVYCAIRILLISGLGLSAAYAQMLDKETLKRRAIEEYTILAERFDQPDTSLKKEDLQVLYYGFVYTKNYLPEKIIIAENRIREFNNSGEPANALKLADSLLEKYPVSLVALFEKSFAGAALNFQDEEFKSTVKYKAVLKTILSCGDGKSFETAYVINTPNDEFDIIRYSGLTAVSYQETDYNGKTFDVLTLKKNKLKQERFFFDISVYAGYKQLQQTY